MLKRNAIYALRLQYGRARAKAFNVGDSQRQTGVRFADVAGIDDIKAEVKVVMEMLLDAPEYREIGAKPFRVRGRCTCAHQRYAVRAAQHWPCSDGRMGRHRALLQRRGPLRSAACCLPLMQPQSSPMFPGRLGAHVTNQGIFARPDG